MYYTGRILQDHQDTQKITQKLDPDFAMPAIFLAILLMYNEEFNIGKC